MPWLPSNRSSFCPSTRGYSELWAAAIQQFWSTPRPPTYHPTCPPTHPPPNPSSHPQPENHPFEHFGRSVNSDSSLNCEILSIGGRIPAAGKTPCWLHICCVRTQFDTCWRCDIGYNFLTAPGIRTSKPPPRCSSDLPNHPKTPPKAPQRWRSEVGRDSLSEN